MKLEDLSPRHQKEAAEFIAAKWGKKPAALPHDPAATAPATPGPAPAKLIRQDKKPKLNKLETAALAWLQAKHPEVRFHSQEWRVRLANGAWFKVDHCGVVGSCWTAWECKEFRGKNVDRGILALKVAASQFPEVRWVLLSRNRGVWHEQVVLP